MRPRSAKAAKRARAWAEVTRQAIAANRGACAVGLVRTCTLMATEGHHKLGRAQGGPDTLENCLPACHGCHSFLTTHPAWAYAHGYSLRRAGRGE